MVMQKLPITWLQSHVPDIIKAALAVLKHLPGHASLEQAQLLKALTTVMHLVVPKVQTGWKHSLLCDFWGLSGGVKRLHIIGQSEVSFELVWRNVTPSCKSKSSNWMYALGARSPYEG
jgi:hypothetical protein